jgi:putative inorganic carbon (hco3(-)) transporter
LPLEQAEPSANMRDFLVVLIVFGSIPLILVRPQVGIILWYWISLMSPHRLSWGYAYALRVALVVGLVTIVSWLLSRERKFPPATAATYFLAALTLWVSVSTLFALVPDSAYEKWEEVIKILGMTFVAACIVNSKERILQLVWIVALSLGFFGIKGGVFGIATGGTYRVWGPENSFIGDNNSLGLALIMILPLIHFLSTQTTWRWLRVGLIGSMVPIIVAILCTYSRGDFLALAITLVAFWMKAKRRLLSGVVALACLAVVAVNLPASWYERMETINQFGADESAQGRINSWVFALRLAADRPLTGGGFRVVDDSALYFRYIPNADVVHNFHSIYFEVLGEHGYVGLIIFLGLIVVSLMTAQSIIRKARGHPDLEWAQQLAAAIQVSIVGYCAAGAFLNLGFYDLFYVLVVLLIATKVVVMQAVAPAPQGTREFVGVSSPLGAMVSGDRAVIGQEFARDADALFPLTNPRRVPSSGYRRNTSMGPPDQSGRHE